MAKTLQICFAVIVICLVAPSIRGQSMPSYIGFDFGGGFASQMKDTQLPGVFFAGVSGAYGLGRLELLAFTGSAVAYGVSGADTFSVRYSNYLAIAYLRKNFGAFWAAMGAGLGWEWRRTQQANEVTVSSATFPLGLEFALEYQPVGFGLQYLHTWSALGSNHIILMKARVMLAWGEEESG